MEVIKEKVAGSVPTRLAFPEPVGEGFNIVFLSTLDDTITGIMLTLRYVYNC